MALSFATSYSPSSFSASSDLQTPKISSFLLQIQPQIRILSRNSKNFVTHNKSVSRLQVQSVSKNTAAVVSRESWDKMILGSDIPVLVEFYASWCGPCRMVHRVIDEIATEYSGQVKCFLLDADNDSQIAEDYDIKAVPVVLLFKNGEKRESVVGTMPKEFYVAAIDRVLAS